VEADKIGILISTEEDDPKYNYLREKIMEILFDTNVILNITPQRES